MIIARNKLLFFHKWENKWSTLEKEKKYKNHIQLPNGIIPKDERTSKECLQTPYLVLGEKISDFRLIQG